MRDFKEYFYPQQSWKSDYEKLKEAAGTKNSDALSGSAREDSIKSDKSKHEPSALAKKAEP